jgi:hypothetical protein
MSETKAKYHAGEPCYTAAEIEQAIIAIDEATDRIGEPISAGVWRLMVLDRLAVDRFVNLAAKCETVAQLEAVISQARAELSEGQLTSFLGRTIRSEE